MTEEILFYDSKTDRRSKLDIIKSQGKTLIHDDFIDNTGRITDGTSGRLTFDVYVKPTPTSEETRRKAIENRIIADDVTLTLEDIIELEKLKLGEGLRIT